VFLDESKSGESPVPSGVNKHSGLRLVLFVLFINDLSDYISPESTIEIFAYDCAIYCSIKLEEDATLQKYLDGLQRLEKDRMTDRIRPSSKMPDTPYITNKRKPIRQTENTFFVRFFYV
jgi:hypothetical protein